MYFIKGVIKIVLIITLLPIMLILGAISIIGIIGGSEEESDKGIEFIGRIMDW